MDAARLRAHLERHQRSAVVEVDADPVPARRFRRTVGPRPLMIEPRATANGSPIHGAGHCEMRLAIVVARLLRAMTFAAEARFALRHGRARCAEPEVELEFARGDLGVIAI